MHHHHSTLAYASLMLTVMMIVSCATQTSLSYDYLAVHSTSNDAYKLYQGVMQY